MSAAAILVASRLRDEWLAERRRLDALLAECAATKTTPPANYWEAEHRARGRLRIADVLAEELPRDA